MRIRFRYYPTYIKVAMVATVPVVALIVYMLFFVRYVPDRDSEIEQALAMVDNDAPAALRLLDNYIARDTANAARAEALRSFGRFLIYNYTDSTDSYIDTAAIITLRRCGRADLPILARGLLAYGIKTRNRQNYQSAINAIGECADRALNQLSDTLLAARANRNLGHLYDDISAFQQGVRHMSIGRDLFTAIDQQSRADLCRVAMLSMLGRSFDINQVREAVAILDSLKPRAEADSGYWRYLNYSLINLQPRMRAELYDEAISYGRKLLSEDHHRPTDSLWAYAQMAKAATRSHRFREARQWLDSAKQFQHYIARDIDGTRLSLTGIELALTDSLSSDSRTNNLRRTLEAENDTLFAMYKRNIGFIRPSYTLEADHAVSSSNRRFVLIGSLTVLVVLMLSFAVFALRVSDLKLRFAALQREYESISDSASSLFDRITVANSDIENLTGELLISNQRNNELSDQITDYRQKLDESHYMARNLTEMLREADSRSNNLSGSNERIISHYISTIDSVAAMFPADIHHRSRIDRAIMRRLDKFSDYLHSSQFSKIYTHIAYTVEPSLEAVEARLRVLLGRDLYTIFIMTVAGFGVDSILAVVGIKRTALYRRREKIENILLDTADWYFQSLAEKYIRHYNKPLPHENN